MAAIEELAAKKKRTKNRVKTDQKDLVNKYIKDYFAEVENLITLNLSSNELIAASFDSLRMKIQSIDNGANITSWWSTSDDGKIEAVSYVKIVWSSSFSAANGIERELMVDQFDSLLKEALS